MTVYTDMICWHKFNFVCWFMLIDEKKAFDREIGWME